MDPVPTTNVPPTTGRISSFLSYIRRSVADDATATAASAAETLAAPPSLDVNVDTDGGTTASAGATDATVGGYDAAVGDLSPPATDDATMPTASAAATLADFPSPGVAGGSAKTKRKRDKRKYAPAKAGRLQRRWCDDGRVLDGEVRTPDSGGAQAGGDGGSGM